MSWPGGLSSVALANIGIKPRPINAGRASIGTEPLRAQGKRNDTRTAEIQSNRRLKRPPILRLQRAVCSAKKQLPNDKNSDVGRPAHARSCTRYLIAFNPCNLSSEKAY